MYRPTLNIGKCSICIFFAPLIITSPMRGITYTFISFITQYLSIIFLSWLCIPLRNTVSTPSRILRSVMQELDFTSYITLNLLSMPYSPNKRSIPSLASYIIADFCGLFVLKYHECAATDQIILIITCAINTKSIGTALGKCFINSHVTTYIIPSEIIAASI